MTELAANGRGVKKLKSAGGVVIRRRPDGGHDVVVCVRRRPQVWALPKGTPAHGETVAQTAEREVREETGLEVKAGRLVGDIHYSFYVRNKRARYDKTVTFFLMLPTGGDTSQHDGEFDDVKWLDVAEAKRRLTHANEARILETAVAMAAQQEAAQP